MANILIADPSLEIRKMIAESLKDGGHTLYHAEDGGKAVNAIRESPMHLLIADSDLPGMDGFEILREIRQSKNLIPAIIMVDLGCKNPDEYLDEGAYATLAKPFNLQDLKKIVSEAVPKNAETAAWPASRTGTEVSKRGKGSWKALGFAAVLVLAGILGYWGRERLGLSKSPPIRIFALPYANISGMTFDGNSLWTCDWFNAEFYRHRLDAPLTLESTFKANGNPSGLAWDGKALWSVSSWSRKLSRHKLDGALSIEEDFDVPLSQPGSLYFDGESFWITDARKGLIAQCVPEGKSLKTVKTVPSPAQKPVGTCKLDGILWSADSGTGFIYKHGSGEDLKAVEVYALPDPLAREKMSAFTSDGKSFWIGMERTKRMYELSPRHLKLISSPPSMGGD